MDETATGLSNTKIKLLDTTKTDVLKKELEALQRNFEEKMVMVKSESPHFPLCSFGRLTSSVNL